MGAWGVLAYENDTAADWLYDLVESGDSVAFLRQSLDLTKHVYIDADAGMAAVAAAELVCMISGKVRHDDAPEEAAQWIKEHAEEIDNLAVLKKDAISVLEKILSGDSSELYELWQESESFEEWLDEIKDLIDHLKT